LNGGWEGGREGGQGDVPVEVDLLLVAECD